MSTPSRVLVVDDETQLRDALGRYFMQRGFAVQTAASGDEALAQLKESGADIMLLDIRMPGRSGIDLLPEALEIAPDLGVVMLSGMNDAHTAALCMQRGALDYLTKPIELTDLGAAVDRALRRRDTLVQNRGITQWLEEEVEERAQELVRERGKQDQLTVATLEALVNALEAKDAYLTGHSARVAALAATIATELKLPDDEVERVRIGGRLHDIGKIGVRDSVLDKKGTLTPEEYAHVKQHVITGAQILAPLKQLADIVSFVRGHHEHWDGSGYPDGLKGEAIPQGARILGAAEVYDALTTERPYQKKMTPDEATQRMRLLSGTVLDPGVLDALEAAVKRRRTLVFLHDQDRPRPE